MILIEALENRHKQALERLPPEILEYLSFKEFECLKALRRAKGEEAAEIRGQLILFDSIRRDITDQKKRG